LWKYGEYAISIVGLGVMDATEPTRDPTFRSYQ